MTATDVLIHGTAYVAVVLFAVGLVGRRRWPWTLGCAAAWVHVLCAFHWQHDWSHETVVEATARQTAEVTGFDWGGGVYVNYVFLLVWAGDVLWWWLARPSYVRRSALWDVAIVAFLVFIVFNAVFVFGGWLVRSIGLAVCVALWLQYARYRPLTPRDLRR